MFYESNHALSADYFHLASNKNLNYPAHLHHCFECICVIDGEMLITVGAQDYNLSKGDAAMIFPHQIHALKTLDYSKNVLCIFSPELVSAYSSGLSGFLPENNSFHPDRFYVDKLISIGNDPDKTALKGLLYSLCAEFDRDARYKKAPGAPETLLGTIFSFIDKNYDSDCSLSALSKASGYGYTYLSAYFRRAVGMTYNDYLTSFRLGKVCYLLENSDLTVLSISNECGFGSLRSLNRNFRSKLGMTPEEYRAAHSRG